VTQLSTAPHLAPAASHTLVCHAAHPSTLRLDVCVAVAEQTREQGPGLLLRFEVLGDMRQLRIPAKQAPGPADDLWRHTCFECFCGVVGEPGYREFNFSPSGQWAAYRFSAQRQRDTAEHAMKAPPQISVQSNTNGLSLWVWLAAQALPDVGPAQYCEMGLCAVIETHDGHLSYWALRHPLAHPDFHHRGGFACAPALPPLYSETPCNSA